VGQQDHATTTVIDRHNGVAVDAVVREPAGTDQTLEVALVEDDLLVEEISIDGMCGVY
jgi:mycofactocin precursor